MLYFDNAATTKISNQALEEFNNACSLYFNPSSLYEYAGDIKTKIETIRTNILRQFNAKTGSSLIFTGSATEANNSVLNSCITRKDKKYLS